MRHFHLLGLAAACRIPSTLVIPKGAAAQGATNRGVLGPGVMQTDNFNTTGIAIANTSAATPLPPKTSTVTVSSPASPRPTPTPTRSASASAAGTNLPRPSGTAASNSSANATKPIDPSANTGTTGNTTNTIPTRHETLIFTDGLIWVDCKTKRPSVLVNGTTPAPTLRFRAGERVIIRVVNSMAAQNLTVHWHGLVQRASPWSDGTPLISQWPIPPGAFFEYEMILGVDDEGTYWYHTHVGLITTQWGVFIVEPRKTCPVFSIDGEKILQVRDHYSKTDAQAETELSSLPFIWPGSTTHYLGAKTNGTWTGDNCAWTFPVIEVEPDKLYRFRWINGGALYYTVVEIQGHSQQIIEADGSATKPVDVPVIELGIGQRLSSLVKTKSAAELAADGQDGLYLIKMTNLWRQPQLFLYGVLRYSTSSRPSINLPADGTDVGYIDLGSTPSIGGKSIEDLSATMTPLVEDIHWDDKIEPFVDQRMPDNPSKYVLPVHFYMQSESVGGLPTIGFRLNGRKYWEYNQTDVPYLVQIYEQENGGKSTATNHRLLASPDLRGYDPESDTYVLQPGDVVDIILIMDPYRFPNGTDIPNNRPDHHPLHLHSRKFWILGRGADDFDESVYKAGGYKLRDKFLRRDTVSVFPNRSGDPKKASGGWGWTAIRYQASPYDSMIFPLHCHISAHLLLHMAILFTSGPADMPKLLESYRDGGFLQYNGQPYGNDSWMPDPPTWFTEGAGRTQVKALLDQQDLLNAQNGCSPW